ncbi:MAG TPA: GNAT family protein [Ferruginibacter sp.]|jgi:RimJ/RimL family protein N-acetyltransferase|nr:GNAT family protein [Ferruginibacter sp.]
MIQLHPFGPGDFQQLISWINTEDLLISWSGALFSFPLTTSSLQWYIQNTNVFNESDAFVFKAIETDTGEAVGHISLGGLSWKNRSSRISRVLVAPEHQHKGYCQQIMKAVLKIGFEDLALHRIGLGVYDYNKSAINCYLKSGFSIEGVSRDVLFHNNEFMSMVEMSILAGEWRMMNS